MSFPFSFFSQRRAAAPVLEPAPSAAEEEGEKEAAEGTWGMPAPLSEDIFNTSGPLNGGLAALAVQQSTSGPLAPPLRRPASGLPATTGGLPAAAPAQDLPAALPVRVAPLTSQPPAAPSSQHAHVPSSEVAQLRVEMEQMRQDLFGAAMGVSALKDRLDIIEAAAQQASPGLSPEFAAQEIQKHVAAWLESHLPQQVHEAVVVAVDQAKQQALSALSSGEFFRMPVHPPGFLPDLHLSQAPQILSISPS